MKTLEMNELEKVNGGCGWGYRYNHIETRSTRCVSPIGDSEYHNYTIKVCTDCGDVLFFKDGTPISEETYWTEVEGKMPEGIIGY